MSTVVAALAIMFISQGWGPYPGLAQAATEATSWVYQLSGYKDGKLQQLAASSSGLVVIDLARDGSSDYFTANEIAALKASGKTVLAYFEVGAIENYRPEYASVPSDLKLGTVSGWPGEYYVKYWDSRWWPVVQGRIDQALSAGFDGAYLDMIVTYEEISASAAGTNRSDLASKMVDLIAQVATYAKSKDPDFKVVPQNSPELRTWPKYLPAIDGIGMEQMFYRSTGKPCNQSWCQENRDNAAAIHAAGKPVLSIDYTTNASEITSAYSQSRMVGFLPYVSKAALDRCYQPGVSPLTVCPSTPTPATATATSAPATTAPTPTSVAATATSVPPTATRTPTSVPPTVTRTPTRQPTNTPTRQATNTPTRQPTNTPTRQATNTPTSQPTSTASPQATATPNPGATGWANAKSWVYQLGSYQGDQLSQISNNQFDVAVIDLARDGSSDYFTASEIAALKASGKTVLAYFEVGAIENYRPEYASVPSDLKLGTVSGWPGEYYVKYWDSRWWPVVQGRIDQALSAGFDGAYLDMIVTYEEISASAAGTNRSDLASKMVDLIAQVATYAKSKDPDFKVVPQNSPELRTWPKYLPAIDGIGMEQMFYEDTGQPCNQSWCQENRDNAAAIHAAGKPVLSIDYTTNASEITSAYSQSRAAGFVPYVSVVDLDTCYQSGVSPLTACR